MLVISDTSPIANLLQIGKLDLLEKIYENIIIPPTVWQEILALEQFGYDLSNLKNATWLQIIAPTNQPLITALEELLDRGETEAISLADELHADFLLIDERKGRKIAQDLQLKTIGILGILIEAKSLGLLNEVKPVLNNLINIAGFWISEKLYLRVLNEVGEN
jgi:uncharacterized protein